MEPKIPTENKIDITEVKAENGAASVGINQGIINISNTPLGEKESEQSEQYYLKRVMSECSGLEWLALVQQQDENSQAIGLDAVYTALMTSDFEEQKPREPDNENKRRLSALEMLNRQAKLVLTGVPGSGKSTLVNFIALCMAGEQLAQNTCNLKTLTQPLPDEEGKIQESPQRWDHGVLVPLRIILRDFGVSDCFPALGKEGKAVHLLNFIKVELEKKTCQDYFPLLEKRLREGRVLLLLDGLDEVAEAGERRERLIQCIQDFDRSFGDNRLLVTARPYAYHQQHWKILAFQDTALADFGQGQVCLFIDRWYANRPEIDAASALNRGEELKKSITTVAGLYELAQRPLLLTLMAFLHSNRNELPQRRADLYERLLDLLIEKWEKARFKVKDAKEAKDREQYSLAEYLQVGVDAIRKALERLAFAAHAGQTRRNGTADIAARELSHELMLLTGKDNNPGVNPKEIREYLRDRVGILYKRGGDSEDNAVYTFPHRSFQEYLAAAYFYREDEALYRRYPEANANEWQDIAAYLGCTDADRWREVVVLAGSINSNRPAPIWSLLNSLVPEPVKTSGMSPEQAWGLRLASEIVSDNLNRQGLSPKHRAILENIQQSLPYLLRSSVINATERVVAGRYLAKIGDPRPEVLDVDAMLFCPVPAGSFFLGSSDADTGARDNEKNGAGIYNLDYAYAIARHPVTVAQFRQFVEETGFQMQDKDWSLGAANTPVVYVTWHEAQAFCDWLTQHWRKNGGLSAGWRVGLPSEPEWEKAARGGMRIPLQAGDGCKKVADMISILNQPAELTENPLPQRVFPWGDDVECDLERMNVDYEIQSLSPLGCYPKGMSPYGCEDMAGNVWEWTRSLYQDYPYPEQQEFRQEREIREPGNRPCVLRGGSVSNYRWSARCASRSLDPPDSRDYYLGFRVVLSPYL